MTDITVKMVTRNSQSPPGYNGLKSVQSGQSDWFLPCDVTHAYAVLRCLSVCPSVRHVHVLCQTSNHILKLFSPSGTHTILVFPYFLPNVIAMFWREPPSCGKNVIAIFDQYLAFGSTTAGVSSVVNNFDRGVIYSKRRRLFIAQAVIKKRHASVNLVHGSKHLRYAEENRTEFNCTHW